MNHQNSNVHPACCEFNHPASIAILVIIIIEWPDLFFRLGDPLFSNSEHILQNAAKSSPRLGDRFTSTCLFFIMLLARLGCTECGQSCSQTSSGTFHLAS